MALRTTRSLHLRLWAIIGLACLPVFLMAFLDFRERRHDAVASLENEVNRMLMAVQLTEEAALRSMRQSFQIMARADNLQSLDGADCSGLAQRLMQSMEDVANVGAALPDGTVFCSAVPLRAPVTLGDHQWFRDALEGTGISPGEIQIGPISKKPSMTFGFPVRNAQGQPMAVLFTSIQIGWFDKLVTQFKLPTGWNALLLGSAGEVLSYHPSNGLAPSQRMAPETSQRFMQALHSGHAVSDLEGLDGRRRMYGIMAPRFSRSSMLVAIGAPLDRTVAGIEQGFWLRMALLFGIAMLSALAALYYIYDLIESWTLASDLVSAFPMDLPLVAVLPVATLVAPSAGAAFSFSCLRRAATFLALQLASKHRSE